MAHKKYTSFNYKGSLYSALVFFGTLLALSVWYAAYNLGTESSGAPLTSVKWNAVINAVNDADARISSLSWAVASLQAAGWSFWNAVTGWIWYSGGKVWIGTSTPNKDLHIYNTVTNAEIDIQSVAGTDKHWGIYQNSSDETLRFWNNAGGDALVLTKDGRVGVGTTSPSAPLEVANYSSRLRFAQGLSDIASDATLEIAAINNVYSDLLFSPNSTKSVVLRGSSYGLALHNIDAGGRASLNIGFADQALPTGLYVNGNVGIGTTSPSYKLHVNGTAAGTSWTNLSDQRFKKNIQPISSALDKIEKLRGVTFDWRKEGFKNRNFPDGKQVGFIAQEVEKVIPEIVTTDKDGYKGVEYSNITAVLVEAVKEQQAEIDVLKQEVRLLRSWKE